DAGPVVLPQGPGDPCGGPARRGRGAGARDGEIPGAGAAAGFEALGLVQLPVFPPAGGAVQAPLGHAAVGGVARVVASAADVLGAAGDGASAQGADGGAARARRSRGTRTACALWDRFRAGDAR